MPNIFKMAALMKNKRDNSKENDGTSQAAKKLKLATDLHSDVDENVLHDFDGFKVDKILSESAESKSLFLLGSFSESAKKAVVLLEKKPFLSDDLTLKSLMSKETKLKLGLKNDIYGAYESFPPVEVNGMVVSNLRYSLGQTLTIGLICYTVKLYSRQVFIDSVQNYKIPYLTIVI